MHDLILAFLLEWHLKNNHFFFLRFFYQKEFPVYFSLNISHFYIYWSSEPEIKIKEKSWIFIFPLFYFLSLSYKKYFHVTNEKLFKSKKDNKKQKMRQKIYFFPQMRVNFLLNYLKIFLLLLLLLILSIVSLFIIIIYLILNHLE